MSESFASKKKQSSFRPPESWLSIETIDMHTGGEPLRVILEGFPASDGKTVLQHRSYIKDNFDHLRTALMHEPRGHADMYGCLLVPPNDDGALFGVIFLHNEGYSTMCGHAIIALGTLAIQMNWVEKQSPITQFNIDAPCGRITVMVQMEGEKVKAVSFRNVPSFVLALDQVLQVPGLGKVNYDLAYGGAFYAYVDANRMGLELTPKYYRNILDIGMKIKRAVMESGPEIAHPFEPDLSFLYGTIFLGDPISEGIDSRNVCVFAEGEVDLCPTGSGVSGRLPLHFAKGELKIGEEMTIESITGSVFRGKIIEEVDFGPFKAVIPEVTGTAHITGQHTFLIDPDDPFKNGFFLR